MSTDKSNQYRFYRKLNDHYQTMIVPSDIEHIMLVADTIHVIKHSFHVCKASPLGLLHFLKPVFKSCFRIRVLRVIFNNLASRYNSHASRHLRKSIY